MYVKQKFLPMANPDIGSTEAKALLRLLKMDGSPWGKQ